MSTAACDIPFLTVINGRLVTRAVTVAVKGFAMRHPLALLLLPLAAVAAPVPKEKPDELLTRLWGKAVLPDVECTVAANCRCLTLTSNGGSRPELFETSAKKGTGVRTEWPTSGDFESTVKLIRTTEPIQEGRADGVISNVQSGMYVGGKNSQDKIAFLWIGRQLLAYEKLGKQLNDHSLWRQADGRGARLTGTLPNEEVWVRIIRKSDKWECGRSEDGKKWATWNVEADLSDAVTVGVFLTQSSGPKCESVFSDITITPLKPANKK